MGLVQRIHLPLELPCDRVPPLHLPFQGVSETAASAVRVHVAVGEQGARVRNPNPRHPARRDAALGPTRFVPMIAHELHPDLARPQRKRTVRLAATLAPEHAPCLEINDLEGICLRDHRRVSSASMMRTSAAVSTSLPMRITRTRAMISITLLLLLFVVRDVYTVIAVVRVDGPAPRRQARMSPLAALCRPTPTSHRTHVAEQTAGLMDERLSRLAAQRLGPAAVPPSR